MTNAEREEAIEHYLWASQTCEQARLPLMAKWFRARARELEIQRDKLD